MGAVDDIRAWVEDTRPTDWYGKCAGLTDRVVAAFTGGPRQWYDSATDARRASGPLTLDPTTCPAGGIHHWSFYGTAWDGSEGDWGHVTIDIHGGGTDTLSATGYAHEEWGVHAGLISVAAQSARPGMRYLGWTPTYGAAATLIIPAPSGDNARPLDPAESPEEEDPTMRHLFCRDQGGTGTLWTLLNTATGEIIQTRDGSIATTWNAAWGTRTVDVQSFLNALDAVRKTTTTNATAGALAALDKQITDLRTELTK